MLSNCLLLLIHTKFPTVSVFLKLGNINSSGYEDELLWAGSWLYHATKDPSYLDYVTEKDENEFGSLGSVSWFSWDDKHAAT